MNTESETNVDEFIVHSNWTDSGAMTESLDRLGGNLIADNEADDWRVLQPIWNFFLAHSRYTASPWFPIVVANSFFFVCLIPYIILDFYGLDHWSWVRR
jgi:hypothetical protein